MPEIIFLEISGRETNGQIPVPMNFRSFKGLPKIMPKLEEIWIYDSNIQNFESLTPNMPCLKNFSFLNCHIHNFKGIPKKPVRFGFSECKIDSFEGLHVNNLEMFDDPDSLYVNDNPQPSIGFDEKTEFYSLHGIDRTTLHSILIEYFSKFGNFFNTAKLTPKGLQLLNQCVNRRIYNRHCPLEYVRRHWPFDDPNHIPDSELKDTGYIDWYIVQLNERGYDYHSIQEWNEDKAPDVMMENWVYGHDLEEELFIPEKIDRLLQFYEKSPTELALQYRFDPKSLPKDQIDRLIHEADHQTLQILEDDEFSTLPKNDPVIARISKKFAVKTQNGKILL